MADARVTCITRQPRKSPHEGITHLGGHGWKRTRAEVIAAAVRAQLPNARIDFVADPTKPALHGRSQAIDDSHAREEWGWQPTHDLTRMIDDFVAALV